MKKIFLLGLFTLLSTIALTLAADNMKAFPPAEKGMVRHVLHLQPHIDESALKVELIAGKTVEVDASNNFFFGGKIETHTIEGWGFPRYDVSALGPMAGTLMAIDPNAVKVERFITLGKEPYLIRYNSRLPIVLYAPEGVEIQYRIWSAQPTATAIKKG